MSLCGETDMKRSFCLTTVLLFFISTALYGRGTEDYPRSSERERGTSLGVARISVADGDVSIRRPSGDQEQAQAGMALVGDDLLITGADSRAEVQLDRGNFLRLGSNSELKIGDLGNRSFRVELLRGLAGLTQFGGAEADVNIETSHASVRTVKPSVFTVEFRDVGQTNIIVRDGAVEVFTDRGVQRVKDGALVVRAERDQTSVRGAKAGSRDEFEEWAKHRDKILDRDRRRGWFPSYLGLGLGYGGYYPFGYGGYGGYGRRYYGRGYYRPRVSVRAGYAGRRGGGRRR